MRAKLRLARACGRLGFGFRRTHLWVKRAGSSEVTSNDTFTFIVGLQVEWQIILASNRNGISIMAILMRFHELFGILTLLLHLFACESRLNLPIRIAPCPP